MTTVCGLDIHKGIIPMCIIKTNGKKLFRKFLLFIFKIVLEQFTKCNVMWSV